MKKPSPEKRIPKKDQEQQETNELIEKSTLHQPIILQREA